MEKVVKDVFNEDELKARRANAPDVKESFESGREDDAAMPNIWLPDGVLPGFKEACLDFFWVGYPFYPSTTRTRLTHGAGVQRDRAYGAESPRGRSAYS